MKSWLGLVVAPTVALAAQSAMYALVTPSCGHEVRVTIHLVAALALLVAAGLTVLAFRESSLGRGARSAPADEGLQPAVPRRFLADCAAAVAALSCLVILGMWFAAWVLSPCELF